MELIADAEGVFLLYYNPKAYVGIGFTGEKVRTYQYAESREWASVPLQGRKVAGSHHQRPHCDHLPLLVG